MRRKSWLVCCHHSACLKRVTANQTACALLPSSPGCQSRESRGVTGTYIPCVPVTVTTISEYNSSDTKYTTIYRHNGQHYTQLPSSNFQHPNTCPTVPDVTQSAQQYPTTPYNAQQCHTQTSSIQQANMTHNATQMVNNPVYQQSPLQTFFSPHQNQQPMSLNLNLQQIIVEKLESMDNHSIKNDNSESKI